MGVYGNLLTAFPELVRMIAVFTKKDKSDLRKVRGIYIPKQGDYLNRQKITSRGNAVQSFGDDVLYVSSAYKGKITLGDYFYSPDDASLQRVIGRGDWNFEGGYVRFVTERVTGWNVDQDEDLKVKEAEFA